MDRIVKEAEKEEKKKLGSQASSEHQISSEAEKPKAKKPEPIVANPVNQDPKKAKFVKYETKGHQHEHELSVDSALLKMSHHTSNNHDDNDAGSSIEQE